MIDKAHFVELIDSMCSMLMDKKNEGMVIFLPDFITAFLENKGLDLQNRQKIILRDDIYKTKMFDSVFIEDLLPDQSHQIYLSKYGIKLLTEHESYANFIDKEDKEKRKAEKKERWKEWRKRFSAALKDANTILTLIFGAATIAISIISLKQEANLSRIEQTLEQQSKKIDSILQHKSNTLLNKK